MTSPFKILVLCDYYFPGYKAGGPIRTLVNMIEFLGDRYAFEVITRDRDLGENKPYGIDYTTKIPIGKAHITFLSPSEQSFSAIRKRLDSFKFDLIYLNSFFSFNFSIKLLFLRLFGRLPKTPVILAPRGEFSTAAMKIRGLKKHLFIFIAKITGSHRDIVWQASSNFEAEDIRRYWGIDTPIVIAADLFSINRNFVLDKKKPKLPGCLRLVFLSRISKMKNLDYALKLLNELNGQVQFDIYGPIEDHIYWKQCLNIIDTLPGNITVKYCGEVPNCDAIDVLSRYELFLLPTRGENFGHVIVEALSSGCPVLISNNTPWRELENLGIGWDVSLESPNRFKEVLQTCIDMDDMTFNHFSQRALAYVSSPDRQRVSVEMNCFMFDSVLNQFIP